MTPERMDEIVQAAVRACAESGDASDEAVIDRLCEEHDAGYVADVLDDLRERGVLLFETTTESELT